MPMMCGNAAHLKYFSYCEDCAKRGCDIHQIFFCLSCQKDKKQLHKFHKDEVMYMDDPKKPKFTQAIAQLKSVLFKQVQAIKQKVEQKKQNPANFTQIMNNAKQNQVQLLKLLDEKEKFSTLLLNEDIMKWLLEVKFWQARNRTTFIQFESRIKTNVVQKMSLADKKINEAFNNSQQEVPKQNFSVVWPENKLGQMIEKEIENLKAENSHRTKQIDICQLIIKLHISFNVNQCWQTESECQQLIKKYPDSKVLYLALIRLNELIPNGNEEIPRILQQIVKNVDPNFDSTDIYHYYMAMAQWQIVDEKDGEKYIFFELKNKRYYRMVNADAYLASLNKAIAVRQKPVYYMSLGLGHIVKENFKEALRVFRQASSLIANRNDALDLNKFWTEIKVDGEEIEFESIMENLETRSLQFITNVCKYFKSSKHYSELVECCEELIAREPKESKRVNFKIHFIKAILSYSSVVERFTGDDTERLKRAELMIIDIKRAEQKEASKLQKRLTRVKAQNEYKSSNFSQASDEFSTLARGTSLTTGSDYYNYSASLFNLFVQHQCVDEDFIKQAYENINKALRLKPDNIKYKKLKFFICSYMNLFNEANRAYLEVRKEAPGEIPDKEYERLVEFVGDNLEVETPMG